MQETTDGRTEPANNQRKKVRILNPCFKSVARNYHSARAFVISAKTHHGSQEMKEEREREAKSQQITSVHTKHLLPAHSSQLVQCARTLRSDRFPSLAFVDGRNPKGGCTQGVHPA